MQTFAVELWGISEALRESMGNSMSQVVRPLSPNILGHIPNGDAQDVDPLDPCNRLQPFITSCCSDFQDAFSPAGPCDLPSPGLAFDLCIGFVVLAQQVDVPDSD